MAVAAGTSDASLHRGERPADQPGPTVSFAPDTRVEVWCPSLDRWVEGFEAISVGADGWTVRRRSDGQTIPDRFAVERVRVLGRP